MRKAVAATRTLAPHPNPSPEGEGLNPQQGHEHANRHEKALLPREKGWDEGQQSLLKGRARKMRAQPTPAENLLWKQLRNRRFLGHKFRRQVPIGQYIVDFLCEDEAIIIELDGGQHADAIPYDQQRTLWLESRGFRVLRVWNHDVMGNIEAVLEQLLSTLPEKRTASAP